MNELLRKMRGRFWTREDEMIADIENETDFDVLGVFYGYMNVIDRTESDAKEYEINLIRAGNTIAIE